MTTRTATAGIPPTSTSADNDADEDDGAGSDTGGAPPASGQSGAHAPPHGSQADEEPDGTLPPDSSSSPAGQQSGDDDGEDTSKIKKLSDEAAKYRTRAKAVEEALDAANATIKELRIGNAFIRAALPVVDDLDAAWKLADHTLVSVDDDGNVTGMNDMINSVVRNYPYLERQPDTIPYAAPGSGGTPANGRRKIDTASHAALEKKFPALRSRWPRPGFLAR